MGITWTTKRRKVKNLVAYEDNPRVIKPEDLEKLAGSIDEFGLVEIPAIDQDNTVLAGNRRVEALLALGRGDESIDVRYPSRKLSENERKKYAVIANTHAGTWDFEKLEHLFSEELKALDFPIEGLDRWQRAQVAKSARDVVDDDCDPDLESGTSIAPGDLIEIGPHRLICGNAQLGESYDRLLGPKAADLIVTDPPYNVSYVGKTKDALTIMNDEMAGEDFSSFLEECFTCMEGASASGAPVYIFHADSEGHHFRNAMMAAGLPIRQVLIWVKDSMVLGRQDYHWQHEPILEGEVPDPMHEPVLYAWKKGSHLWASDRRQTTLLEYDRPKRSREHPTMKPLPLLAYLIGNSSEPGGLVLDPFLGSGSTMLAAHQMGRVCYGLELDPVYCQVILDRMRAWDNTLVVTVNGKNI